MTTDFTHSKGLHTERTIYIVAWILLFATPFMVQFYDLLSGADTAYEWGKAAFVCSIMSLYLICFLINDFVLLTKLFLAGHRAAYILSLAALITIFAIIAPVPPDPPMPPIGEHGPPPISPSERVRMFHSILLLCLLLLNDVIKMYFRSIAEAHRIKEMQNEQTRIELQTLRYQINPHFMMNTLNNIQALIDISPERAEKAIQQLSHLMRYMLHDSSLPKVNLSKEIETLRYFISLMRLRYPEDVEIATCFPDDTAAVEVPPLLFISFLENAFKYGIDYDNPSAISVSIKIEDDRLKFLCLNSINHEAQENKGAGTGIANVNKRLALLYGNCYVLDINDNGTTFSVNMEFPISPTQ